MRITIDNQDGLGAVDYSGTVTAGDPIRIVRTLNAPSTCSAELQLETSGKVLPVRRGRVVVQNDAGTLLFTGYLPIEPRQLYAGEGVTGPVYRVRIDALSDEWLLNRAGDHGTANSGTQFALDAATAVNQITQLADVSGVTLATTGSSARALGAFAVSPSANWSTNAAAAANATYSSVHVLNSTVNVNDIGAQIHTLSDADGSLSLSQLSSSFARELANDVTLTGAKEPAAYVQEVFQGDGTTSSFPLSKAPFRPSETSVLADDFDQATISEAQWTLVDGGNHLQLTGQGLTASGGTGLDGQTTLTAVNAVEMGGCLIATLTGVAFGEASDGMLSGFYCGSAVLSDCLAGFRVRQSSSATGGVTIIFPVVQGSEVGQSFVPISGHRYTLRVRLYCDEVQRVPQRYYCMVDGVVQGFGGVSGMPSSLQVVFDVLDEGASSNTPTTVLYDSAAAGAPVTESPALCRFVLMNATNLYASIRSMRLARPATTWVVSTLPNGAQQTRLAGAAGEGVDCEFSNAGGQTRLTFFSGRVPEAQERVTVRYRQSQRSVARLADAASVASETAAGAKIAVPGVSRWFGSIDAPTARSSMDCEAAAQAVLAMATARSAAMRGTYTQWNPAQDIWPGDVLQMNTPEGTLNALVRQITIRDCHAIPELLQYECLFANDWATEWADGLGLRLSETSATDAVLPQQAASGPALVSAPVQGLQVAELDERTLQLDTGLIPPSGGGFEVRRRDGVFGLTVDTADLVLRSPVRSFSIPRSAQLERFFVRMYDGSVPPVYSRFSSAVFVNWPLAAD